MKGGDPVIQGVDSLLMLNQLQGQSPDKLIMPSEGLNFDALLATLLTAVNKTEHLKENKELVLTLNSPALSEDQEKDLLESQLSLLGNEKESQWEKMIPVALTTFLPVKEDSQDPEEPLPFYNIAMDDPSANASLHPVVPQLKVEDVLQNTGGKEQEVIILEGKNEEVILGGKTEEVIPGGKKVEIPNNEKSLKTPAKEVETFNLAPNKVLTSNETQYNQQGVNDQQNKVQSLPYITLSSSDGVHAEEEYLKKDQKAQVDGFSFGQALSKQVKNNEEAKIINLRMQELPKELPKIIESQFKLENGKQLHKDVVIHLEPKELGKMVLKLSEQDGIVSVKIITEHVDTKLLLENGLSNLRQTLSEQGIKFGKMDIELGGQFLNHQQQQQPNWGQEQGTFIRNTWTEGSLLFEDELQLSMKDPEIKVNSAIDYRV